MDFLLDLYDLGVRKTVVFEIGPLGCLPYIMNRVNASGRCDENVNELVSIFNDKLKAKLKKLNEKLKGSTFVTTETSHFIRDMVEKPNDYRNSLIYKSLLQRAVVPARSVPLCCYMYICTNRG